MQAGVAGSVSSYRAARRTATALPKAGESAAWDFSCAVVLQVKSLTDYPMVRRRVESGHFTLHGWH